MKHLPKKLHFNFLDENSDGCDCFKNVSGLKTIKEIEEAAYTLVDKGLEQYNKSTEAKRRRKTEMERNQLRMPTP